ncbi:GNAT family N-acetyltransferase [Populibacterium corticicola]|uniref:GNAT family N-acetyltransferase n=1 Tax=Populibacterium corticicola TaxID=1812826 RepID=A0ABW5XHX4_9MICO
MIRRFSPEDAVALHGYLSRPEAVQFEPYGLHTLEDCYRVAAERANDERFLAVSLGDGTLVDNLYLAPEGPEYWNTWQIGYVFHPDHWGQGYATESLSALLEELFSHQMAHRVVARCNPLNTRSWRLLERVGLRREAHHLAAASFAQDINGALVWHDTYVYALLDTEWDC